MKMKHVLAVVTLFSLLVSWLPAKGAAAIAPDVVPPVDMFQLPWQQGESWVAYDGFDNGLKRLLNSPHYYLNGGAVDFAPHANMRLGEDTSNAWVTAAAAGVVVQTTGCSMMIDHGNGWIADYQFLARMQVKLGDTVYRNQRLAIIADGVRQKFCPPALEPDIPHVHFSLRPNMRNATFAGWQITYLPLLNKTSFTRNGQTLGSYQPLLNSPGVQIALRETVTWDTTYSGSVDASRYERWPFTLAVTTNFTVTATPTTTGLIPLVVLLDASGTEITQAAGTLTVTEPAGSYFVEIRPQQGSGFYHLVLHQNSLPVPSGPNVSTSVTPANVAVGASAAVSASLGSVPAEGYTSTEFTCTYDASIVEAGNITAAGLFGSDPAVAIHGPENGSFIVAIAGSNGQKATSDGVAVSFSVTGLQAGQTAIECKARVSKGDNTLTDIQSAATALTVGGAIPTPTSPATLIPAPGGSETPTLQPSSTSTAASATPTPIGASATPTVLPSPSATPTPLAVGMLTGRVLAGKPVTVSLFKADGLPVASVTASSDGSFSLTAPAGAYIAVASAEGFLKAQGSVTLTEGGSGSLSTVSLVPGDIDGNNVINQYDALTIGMNYNQATPAAADLNSDGIINVLDLELLAKHYRASGALVWE